MTDGWHRSLRIARALPRRRCAIPLKCALRGKWGRRCRASHPTVMKWCGLESNQERVMWVHANGFWLVPSWARMSARLFPHMFTWEGVHFPLMRQSARYSTFTYSKHSLMYSRPTDRPPASALRAFWLSTQNVIQVFFSICSTSRLRTPCTECNSPSSMSHWGPIWPHPSNRRSHPGPVTQNHSLLVVWLVIFDMALSSQSSGCLVCRVHSLCLTASAWLVEGTMSGRLIHGRLWTEVSSRWPVSGIMACTMSTIWRNPQPICAPGGPAMRWRTVCLHGWWLGANDTSSPYRRESRLKGRSLLVGQ